MKADVFSWAELFDAGGQVRDFAVENLPIGRRASAILVRLAIEGELCGDLDWEDTPDRGPGLESRILGTYRGGPSAAAEIKAYRDGVEWPRTRTNLSWVARVELDLDEVASLDTWIARSAPGKSRHDAMRIIVLREISRDGD